MDKSNKLYMSTFYWGLNLLSEDKFAAMSPEQRVYTTQITPLVTDLEKFKIFFIPYLLGLIKE